MADAPTSPVRRRFDVALSFPGEHRRFVAQVAQHLAARVDRERVLYDRFCEAEFARVNLDVYLPRLYREDSELIVLFLCPEYAAKRWCQLEWRHIRQLLATAEEDRIMLLSFGDPGDRSDLGIVPGDGFADIRDRGPDEIAQLILQRLGPPPPKTESPPTHTEVHGFDTLRIYGEGFAGRVAELAALEQAWGAGARLLTFHAEGGAGKTRVVTEWLRRLRDEGWRGAGRVFVHSFYSQGSRETSQASSDPFFAAALPFFGHEGAPITDSTERGRALAHLLTTRGGLLVLDGLEPLQHPTHHPEAGKVKDAGLARLIKDLAAAGKTATGRVGLCVLTSRQPVVELRGRLGETVQQLSLERLSPEDGAELLRQAKIRGSDRDLTAAVNELGGHAYSLMLLGSYLTEAADGDIRKRDTVKLLDEDQAAHGNHAGHIFAAYVDHLGGDSPEVAALRLLGFFDRAADAELLEVLRKPEGTEYDWSEAERWWEDRELAEQPPESLRPEARPLPDELTHLTAPLADLSPTKWRRLLKSLEKLHLIQQAPEGGAVEAHPLLREYFAEELRRRFPEAARAGHRRLFEHLAGTAPYWPEGLDGLAPLYQAVHHGCQAGLYERAMADVYDKRILRGTGDDGFYSTRKLGAVGLDLGAVACFFTAPWSTLAPELSPADQAWLLNEAAFSLRALGRLREAVEPMEVSMKMDAEKGEWKGAAISASNLSELQLTLGEVSAAVRAGQEAVAHADRSEDASQQMARRTTQADALHQAGRWEEARGLFEDAEARQAARQPGYPRLYSVQGFQYCDLLLSGAERVSAAGARPGTAETAAALDACQEVEGRAEGAQRMWRELASNEPSALDVGLDHLTLARVGLYRALLQAGPGEGLTRPLPPAAWEHAEAAVAGLRAAGQLDYLTRGLLTRAWMRHAEGDRAGCEADLAEAWEIAEAGPMPLFQADILLLRGRLFRDPAALAEARVLIERHGYGRRMEELEASHPGWRGALRR